MSNKIYVAGNTCMPNISKIGYSDDPEKRIKELSGTNVPVPYELYCSYEIPDELQNGKPDLAVHTMIEMIDPSLRIAADREFFLLPPDKMAKVLKLIAELNGRLEFFREYTDWKKDKIQIKTSKHSKYPAKLEIHKNHCVLKTGSRLKLTSGDTLDPKIKKERDNIISQHCDSSGILLTDISLASSYVAAGVLIGNKVNADAVWE